MPLTWKAKKKPGRDLLPEESQQYEALVQADSAQMVVDGDNALNSPRSNYVHWLVFGTVIGSLATVAIQAFSVSSFNLKSDAHLTSASALHTLNRFDCGSTPFEAQNRGCQFDMFSFSWLHPSCYDAELTAEFLEARPWQWWTSDARGMSLLDEDLVRKGELEGVHVSWEYHLLHCTYMWRKLHRALLPRTNVSQKPLTGNIADYEHIDHCEKIFLNRQFAMNDTNTMLKLNFPYCELV